MTKLIIVCVSIYNRPNTIPWKAEIVTHIVYTDNLPSWVSQSLQRGVVKRNLTTN